MGLTDSRPMQGTPAPEPTLTDVLAAVTKIGHIVAEVVPRVEALAERVEMLAATIPQPPPEAEPEPSPDEPVTVVNRTPGLFAVPWNGVVQRIPPNGKKIVPRWLADHMRKHSAFALDVASERCEYKVGIEGLHDVAPLSPAMLEKYKNELFAFPDDWAPRSIITREPVLEETMDRPPPTVMRADGGNRAGIPSLLAIPT